MVGERIERPTGPAANEPRLGLSSGALYPDVPTEDAPAIAVALGLRDLELMLQTAGEYDPAFIQLVAANAGAAGGRVHAVHLLQALHPVISPYRRRAAEARALFERGIEAATTLGASVVVWHGPSRAEVTATGGWGAFLRAVEALAPSLAAAKLTLAIENVSWCALPGVREVAAFATRIPELGPPGRIGFAFDPFQAAEAGANPFMVLAAMGEHVADAHVSDLREGDRAARHLPPGEGDLPWPALVRAIVGAYRGPIMLEGIVGAGTARLAPGRALLEGILAEIARTHDDPCRAEAPAGLVDGIRLFNAGRFYECHEAIEAEWHAERRPIRRLYQGILQIGVGFHHALSGNQRGADALLTAGIEKATGFVPVCLGFDVRRLVLESQDCLDRVRQLGPEQIAAFDPATIPTIHRVASDPAMPAESDPEVGPATID